MSSNLYIQDIEDISYSEDYNTEEYENFYTKKGSSKHIYEDSVPWIEKYRPNSLKDISSQEEVKKMLNKTLITGELPHLLFYGPPGTGKTSTILAVAKQLFGPNTYKDRVVELNASDERGIGVVRNKIGNVAKSALSGKDSNYPCPDFRIIILDEADAMTNDAQSALRITMEKYSRITRFCFICNYIDQIIDPIASRCVKFRFTPIPISQMEIKLSKIAKNENINIKNKYINTICISSEGDMRKAITYLQNTKYIKIDDKSINNLCNIYSDSDCQKIIDICEEGKIYKIINHIKFLKREGISVINVLRTLVKKILVNQYISESNKSKILFLISNTERKVVLGADEYIQLLNIIFKIYESFHMKIDIKDITSKNLI